MKGRPAPYHGDGVLRICKKGEILVRSVRNLVVNELGPSAKGGFPTPINPVQGGIADKNLLRGYLSTSTGRLRLSILIVQWPILPGFWFFSVSVVNPNSNEAHEDQQGTNDDLHSTWSATNEVADNGKRYCQAKAHCDDEWCCFQHSEDVEVVTRKRDDHLGIEESRK